MDIASYSDIYHAVLATGLALAYVLSVPSALEAILDARTAQGAIAWAISLIAFAPISVPLYLVLGRSRFDGYLEQRDEVEARARKVMQKNSGWVAQHVVAVTPQTPLYSSLFRLARMPATNGNKLELLIDGEATYNSIAAGMQAAQSYILFQFYILRDDEVGRRLGEVLAAKAAEGVEVFVLYDEIGSHQFPGSLLHRRLQKAGVKLAPFNTTQGRRNRFQINFRNHRKNVVVDGHTAWIGGLNVGEEYLGRDKRMGYWRDTHASVSGPAARAAEMAFITDWHWATRSPLGLEHGEDPPLKGSSKVLIFPSDPASEYEEAGLMYHQVIVAARRSIWIASPYFVPDNAIVSALQLAALRGVDVRIILPAKTDNIVVGLAKWTYINMLLPAGVKVYLYRQGFMHQKVFLMDDTFAGVGTANCDNRSFRLNFEITLLAEDEAFARSVRSMLEEDLSNCTELSPEDIQDRSVGFHLATGIARLFSPLL
ncbi:MAG: cardiolipin synthase [Halioglobus sp.]